MGMNERYGSTALRGHCGDGACLNECCQCVCERCLDEARRDGEEE